MLFFSSPARGWRRRLHNALSIPRWKRQSEPSEDRGAGGLDLVSRNYQLIIYVYAGPGGGSKAYLPLFPIPEHGGAHSVLLRILTCVARVRGAKGFSSGPLLNTSLKYFPPAITGAVAEIYSRFHTLPRVNSPPGERNGETRVSFEKRSKKNALEFTDSGMERFSFSIKIENERIFRSSCWKNDWKLN